eukprot:jgi/Mesen1/4128/ME000218S03245
MAEFPPLKVGYALREKRIKSFFIPAILKTAEEQNVTFVQIDASKPLVDQGPFDVILQKLDSDGWRENLAQYEEKYPETAIIDKFDKVVDGMADDLNVQLEVPRQLFVDVGTKPDDIQAQFEEPRKLLFELCPAVSSSLTSSPTPSSPEPQTLGHCALGTGSSGGASRSLSTAAGGWAAVQAALLSSSSLLASNSHPRIRMPSPQPETQAPTLNRKARTPWLCTHAHTQEFENRGGLLFKLHLEFENHGGLLFKLYLIGDTVMVFRRQSLPDIPPLGDMDDVMAEIAAMPSLGKQERQQEQQEKEKKEEGEAPAAAQADAAAAGAGGAGGAGEGSAASPADGVGSGGDSGAAVHAHVEEENKTEHFKELVKQGAGLVEFNRISNVHMSPEQLADAPVVDPPPALMRAVALELRNRLGLHLFNVDILRANGRDDRYFIVDINYLPGYERLPGFENTFLEFLRWAVAKKRGTKEEKAELKKDVKLDSQGPYPPLPGKLWRSVRAAIITRKLSR